MKGIIRGRSQAAGTIVIDQKRMTKSMVTETTQVNKKFTPEEVNDFLNGEENKDGNNSSD